MFGNPGIGKMSILRRVAKKIGVVINEVHLLEPVDFRGIVVWDFAGRGKTMPPDLKDITSLAYFVR